MLLLAACSGSGEGEDEDEFFRASSTLSLLLDSNSSASCSFLLAFFSFFRRFWIEAKGTSQNHHHMVSKKVFPANEKRFKTPIARESDLCSAVRKWAAAQDSLSFPFLGRAPSSALASLPGSVCPAHGRSPRPPSAGPAITPQGRSVVSVECLSCCRQEKKTPWRWHQKNHYTKLLSLKQVRDFRATCHEIGYWCVLQVKLLREQTVVLSHRESINLLCSFSIGDEQRTI